MPLPTPHDGEKQNDFVGRFMSATKDEFPDQQQRLAVAFSQWRRKHGGKKPGGKAVNSDFAAFLPVAHIGPLGNKLDKAELLKLDAAQRMAYGWASTPTRDLQDERVSLDAVKAALPGYMEWANIREMHQPSAVGVCKQADVIEGADKDREGLFIAAKVIDPLAWEKIVEGVYKGFSIGGQKIAKQGDLVTKINLFEISLVDRPANPDCKITVWKAAGVDDWQEPEEEKVSAGFIGKILHSIGLGKDMNSLTGDGLSVPAGPVMDPNPLKVGRPVTQSPGRGTGDAVVQTTFSSSVDEDAMDALVPGGGQPAVPPTNQAPTQIILPYLGRAADSNWYVIAPDSGKHLSGPYKSIVEASEEYAKYTSGTVGPSDGKCHCNGCEVEKRAWSGKEKNALPDSAFAYIEPGGDKDEEGKTVPRSLRHFPIKNKQGKLDAPRVRNALARLSQSPHGGKAKSKVEGAARQMGIGQPAAEAKESTLLCMELAKSFGGCYPSTNLSRLAQLWDQLMELKLDLRLESALEGGNGEDMNMAATLDTIQRTVGGLIAQKAEHEVQEDEEEETEKVLLEAGITEGDIDMAKLFQKRVDGDHRGLITKASGHLGKAMAHHAVARKALRKTMDALTELHQDESRKLAAAGAGYPLEELAKYAKAVKVHHQAMAAEMDDIADAHDLAKAALEKVTSTWTGQDDPLKGDRDIPGHSDTAVQSELTEGEPPWYDSVEPYPKDPEARPGRATVDGMEAKVTSKEMMDMAKRLGELEGELKVLRSLPREARGVTGSGADLAKSVGSLPVPMDGASQVRDALMKDIDPSRYDLTNPQDRGRLVASMLTNMNKSDLFARSISDPQFRSTRGFEKGAAILPPTPVIR